MRRSDEGAGGVWGGSDAGLFGTGDWARDKGVRQVRPWFGGFPHGSPVVVFCCV